MARGKGTPGNSWWGVPSSLNPDPISDQKMSFSTPGAWAPDHTRFQTRTLKSIPGLGPGFKAEIMS